MTETPPTESDELLRHLGQWVELSAMPAEWLHLDARQVAHGLVDRLWQALRAELVYVRLLPWSSSATDGAPVEAARLAQGEASAVAVGEALAPCLSEPSPASPIMVPHPGGSGVLRSMIAQVGPEGTGGVVLVGARQPDFPREAERLLLNAVVNQAAFWSRATRLINELREREAALRRSQRELDDFFENAAVALHWVGPDGTIVRANRAELELLGYAPDEYIGHNIAEFHADADVIDDILQRLARRETLHDYEARLRCKDGSIKHVQISSNVMFEGDKFVHTRCFTRDISGQQRIEAERQQTVHRLQALAQASLRISSTLSLEDTLHVVAEQAQELIGAHQCVTSLTVDRQWTQAIQTVLLSDKYAAYRTFDAVPDGSGIYALVSESNHPLRLTQAELEAHPRWRGFGLYAGQHPPLRGLLAAPLLSRTGQNMGLIMLSDKYEGEFTEPDEAILIQLAQMASAAIENARLYTAAEAAAEQAARSADGLARLRTITAELAGAIEAEQVVRIVVHQGASALGAQAGVLCLLDAPGRGLEVAGAVGYRPELIEAYRYIPLEAPVPGAEAARTGQPVWLQSPEEWDARYPHLVEARQLVGYAASCVIPLQAEGRTMGVLAFSFPEPQQFSEANRSFLAALAQECAQALERARLYEAQRQARQAVEEAANRLARLQMVTAALAEALTPQQVAEVILSQGLAAMNAKAGQVLRLTEAGTRLEAMFAAGYPEAYASRFSSFPLSEAMPSCDAVRTNTPLWISSHAEFAERYPAVAAARPPHKFEAVAVVPLRIEGRVLGTFVITFAEAMSFSNEDKGLLLALAQQCAQALERTRLYEAEQQMRANLEVRVRERTAELQQANRALEQSYARLQDMTRRLQFAREEERARLAREIHDELGGALTGLKMDLRRVRRAVQDSPNTLLDEVEMLSHSIDDMVKKVRYIASELRPAILDDFGLTAAIEWQLTEFQRRSAIVCDLIAPADDIALDRDSATAIFRVFQEALTNVARHAQATQVTVRLEVAEGEVRLEVRDNGRGISEAEVIQSHSLGLLGMRERVAALAGQLDVRGVPGQGTTVLIRVPLRPAGQGP